MSLKALENTYLAFMFLIFLGLGFLGTQYFMQHAGRFTGPLYSTEEILRSRELSHRLRRLEYQNATLESEVAELNMRMASLYHDKTSGEIRRLSRMVGLLKQEGPGLEIILKDSNRPLLPGDNPNTGIVHNTDLVQVVNALRASGATAIAINNQPVTTLTGITCSGPIILINGTRVASPFIIQAIGTEPEKMASQLTAPGSFLKELQKYGIEVAVAPKHVEVPGNVQETDRL